MNIGPRIQEHKYLKDISKIVISMDIKHMTVDLMPRGHQTNRNRYNTMENLTIGITIQDILITIIKSMDMLLIISLEHILEVITVDG